MTPLSFFRARETQRMLERAAAAAGMPLGLHYVEHGEESPKIASWGHCGACAYVASLPEGRKACRNSRLQTAEDALREDRAVPFLCHLGFACVSAPALAGEGFVLTFGPFVPRESAESLDFDVRQGLAALAAVEEGAPEAADQHHGRRRSALPGSLQPEAASPAGAALPFALEDLHYAPMASVPVLAQWLREELQRAWALHEQAVEEGPDEGLMHGVEESPSARPRQRRVNTGSKPSPYSAPAIAAAIAGGDQTLARELLLGVLAEAGGQRSRRGFVQRGRIAAAVGAALEALENTGLDTAPGWAKFAEFTAAAQAADSPARLIDAAMLVLAPLRRLAVKIAAPAMDYVELNEIVSARLFEDISLEEAARHLGQTPSAVSQRLRRKFGMNFSEYTGRLRIGRSKELLRRTQLSATEVARRVGIRDQSNFSKLFKRYEGMSPGEYRKKFGKKATGK